MIRASTKNVYAQDQERNLVLKYPEIQRIMKEIDFRVKQDKGTSGFEKLYSKLAGEYFGRMYKFLMQPYEVLDAKGKASLLLSDSHSFKMIHIETARVLGEIAVDIGFKNYDLKVWQYKRSTSHNFVFPEYILELEK